MRTLWVTQAETHDTQAPRRRMTVLALALFVAVSGTEARLSAAQTDPGAMKQARKRAVQRRRRIMYNDDGCHPRPYKTPDELLALRLRQLIGTQVDTICYCTGGGGLFWGHLPQVGERIGEFVTDKDAQYVKDICAGLAALE